MMRARKPLVGTSTPSSPLVMPMVPPVKMMSTFFLSNALNMANDGVTEPPGEASSCSSYAADWMSCTAAAPAAEAAADAAAAAAISALEGAMTSAAGALTPATVAGLTGAA